MTDHLPFQNFWIIITMNSLILVRECYTYCKNLSDFNKDILQQTGQRDKFCDKCLRHENTGSLIINFNFTTEDRNDETMFSETISTILLRAL